MRICLVYDCLYPWTVGGAERWLRDVARALVADGHAVTYLTRLQWDEDAPPQLEGIDVIAVSPRDELYGPDGNRTISEPLRFGLGVARHLARHGRRYDVVHTAAFPYFSLLAAAALRRRGRYRLVCDWYEVWSDVYWDEYLGGVRGRVGRLVQRCCARTRQDSAFCFSTLHAARLRDEGLRTEPTVLRGMYGGGRHGRPAPRAVDPTAPRVVFAGRMIAEKRAPAVVDAVLAARERVPELRATLFGDGPQLADVRAAIATRGAEEIVDAPGFVDSARVDAALAGAMCLLLPSSREGYGLIVVEAAAVGVPVVVCAGVDNAAVEHIQPGVNGFVAPSAAPDDLAAAIVAVHEGGSALRESTADWFAAHVDELSLQTSLRRVVATYAK